MAQIIKHRRGSITQLKDVTARTGEIIMATGSVGTLNGPFTFIGESEGVAGAYRPLSKIYQGSTPPIFTITDVGSILDGTPFYGQTNKTLYILNKDGNISLDLSGNIEGKIVDNLTINNLTSSFISGTNADFINITGSIISGSTINGTNANITSLTGTNLDYTNITGSDILGINGNFTNLTGTTINSTDANITNISATNITGTTINGTNGNITNLTSTNITGTTINGTNANITNVNVSSINVSDNVSITGSLIVSGATTLNSDLYVSGDLVVLGSSTQVIISSSNVVIDDNILTLNSFAPFERYGGIEVFDSGSNTSGSLLWDSQNDNWLTLTPTNESGKIITTTPNTLGSEINLTINALTKATSQNSIGDSLVSDNGTVFTYNTNKFIIDSANGNTTIAGNVTLTATGSIDNGTKTSAVLFRNSSNVLGYVPLIETTNVLDGILGYRNSDGQLVFSTVLDGGTY